MASSRPESWLKRAHRRIERRMFPNDQEWAAFYRRLLVGRRALHLGCGRDLQRVSAAPGGAVVGLDLDAGLLRDYPREYRVRADAGRLPFPDGSFDLVFSEFVFEHLPHPWVVLSEVERVLAKDGRFVLWVPNPRHYYARIAHASPHQVHEWWVRRMGGWQSKDVHPTEFQFGSEADFRAVEARTGLRMEELRPVTGPTSYTIWLPIVHPLVLAGEKLREKFLAPEKRCHSFIGTYTKVK